MESKLEKQWKLTIAELESARGYIPPEGLDDELAKYLHEYNEFLEHNELELALDMLEEIGESMSLPEEFWRSAKKSAEIMGLEKRYTYYLEKIRNARAAANKAN